MTRSTPVLAWHFVGDKLRDGSTVPHNGVTLKMSGPLSFQGDTVMIVAFKLAAGLTAVLLAASFGMSLERRYRTWWQLFFMAVALMINAVLL